MKDVSNRPLRVIYVLCKGRSGSTLLDGLIGDGDSVFSAGELDWFWTLAGRGTREVCSCGAPIDECPIWSSVARHPAVSPILRRDRGQPDRPARVHRDDAVSLYQAVCDVTGSTTIIDSSKSLRAVMRAARCPEIAVSAIHLVRDPRAVAHSWSRPKPLPDRPGHFMQRRGVVDSAVTWIAKNVAIEALLPLVAECSIRVRYEDLAGNPRGAIERIRATLLPDVHVTRRPVMTHQIAGNPSRLDQDEVRIRPDVRWMTEGSLASRLAVNALTWPLAIAYGYHRGTLRTFDVQRG